MVPLCSLCAVQCLVLHQAVLFAYSKFVATTNFPQGKWKEVLILKPDPSLKKQPWTCINVFKVHRSTTRLSGSEYNLTNKIELCHKKRQSNETMIVSQSVKKKKGLTLIFLPTWSERPLLSRETNSVDNDNQRMFRLPTEATRKTTLKTRPKQN